MLATTSAFLGIVLFSVFMAYAGLRDLTAMIIPNALVLVLAAAYLVLAPMAGLDWTQMAAGAGASTLVLAGGFILFGMGWIGGGDAKLAAAASLWLGADQAVPYLLYTAGLGAVLTLGLLAFRYLPAVPGLVLPRWAARLRLRQTGVPYGVALAFAAVLLFPDSAWMSAL